MINFVYLKYSKSIKNISVGPQRRNTISLCTVHWRVTRWRMRHEGSAKTYKRWCWYNRMLRGTCNLFSSSHCSPDLPGLPNRNQVWIEILNSQIYPCSNVCSNAGCQGRQIWHISRSYCQTQRCSSQQPTPTAQYIELQHFTSNQWDYNYERIGYSGNMMGT